MAPDGTAPGLRVEVDSDVDPLLLAPAIRTRLSGGDWPNGPEKVVADAVLRAVADARRRDEATWP